LLSRVQVISAYPITPQTTIVEELSEMVADGRLAAKFITVESEHSAMAACVGASAAGARAYTATSGQGLALMHEMLHWAVGARLPIVASNVTRAMAPGWSIWSEHTDFLSQRDVGWMMLFAESVQEAQDFVIWLYRVAEQVYLPGMVAMDAFILSHTSEPLIVHDQERVDAYLPPFRPLYDSLSIVLRLLRESAQRSTLTAQQGSFQQPLGGKTYQMVQVRLDPACGAIPEISANKYLLWIRFTIQDGDLRPRPFDGTVEFELSLCNL